MKNLWLAGIAGLLLTGCSTLSNIGSNIGNLEIFKDSEPTDPNRDQEFVSITQDMKAAVKVKKPAESQSDIDAKIEELKRENNAQVINNYIRDGF